MDNYFSGFDCFVKLGKVCIKATGTVKRNRKNLPNNFGKEKLEQGNSIFYERGGFLVVSWKCKNEVCVLITEGDTSIT